MGLGTWMAGLAVAATLAADSHALVDPTKPVDYVPISAQTLPDEFAVWRLTAVRIGKNGRSAVLNGKIVRAGDVLGKARIVEIGPGTVIVDVDRKRLELQLHGAAVKTQITQKSAIPVPK